jgi:hypothetical protein
VGSRIAHAMSARPMRARGDRGTVRCDAASSFCMVSFLRFPCGRAAGVGTDRHCTARLLRSSLASCRSLCDVTEPLFRFTRSSNACRNWRCAVVRDPRQTYRFFIVSLTGSTGVSVFSADLEADFPGIAGTDSLRPFAVVIGRVLSALLPAERPFPSRHTVAGRAADGAAVGRYCETVGLTQRRHPGSTHCR